MTGLFLVRGVAASLPLLLSALGSGWHRLGDLKKAEDYFKRLAKEGAGTQYAEKAQFWLEKKTPPQNQSCSGCHSG